MTNTFSLELEIAKDLARRAGQCILEFRLGKDTLQIQEKSNNGLFISPVTAADLKSNEIICSGLQNTFPEYGILSEEAVASNSHEKWWAKKYAWIIDPLDGTEDFIRGGNDFGVHIGLTEEGVPVLGVNYYPATDIMYWAVKGEGAYKQSRHKPAERIFLHSSGDDPILSLRSKSDKMTKVIYELLLQKSISDEEFNLSCKYIGSAGLRLCAIAEGNYNLYVTRATRGGLWDFLSGDVILKEAGGFISDWQGHSIDYRNKNAQLIHGVVACGNHTLYKRLISLLATL